MRVCHACGRKLDDASRAAARCEHCGAAVRPLAQRTIEDRQHSSGRAEPDDSSQTTDRPADAADLPQPRDSAPTYEIGPADPPPRPEARQAPPPGGEARPSGPARKSPTVGGQGDLTIDYPHEAAPSEAPADDGGQSDSPVRRSTHTLESDHTVELGIPPAEAEHISLQWGGTFRPGTEPLQTIRQKETVTGFRSSLPVKSRYIRPRRDAAAEPLHSPAEVPDYELLDIIGEGGMGVVYAAHQSSIARTVAVKMLKPSDKVREEQRDKFISEAVVTGELDHPNIVPIYDLGANDAGALFYSMKRVRGTPWDKVIHQKRLDENLNILLRVADAVAFAHAGGVIHRDLKPENVMLGDYGEVLVMDWGLARVTPEFAHADAVFRADSLGGTPAYMAPEMARGPVDAINKTSDIYLLGAILYEIIGGQPPHSGRDVMQCLMSASQNRIDPIRYDGELKDVALTAMATRQEDRYKSVKDFQEAIRTYQSHSESLVLTAHANQNLQRARESGDYSLYARALYGFQESLALWDANQRARSLLGEAQQDYAESALAKGDFDLADSLLEPDNPDHQPLRARIEAARAEREARMRRLRYAKRTVAALLAIVVATITIAFFNVRAARNEAVHQRDLAVEAQLAEVEARREADRERDAAVAARRAEEAARAEAERQEQIARQEEQRAREQEQIAIEQRQVAEEAKRAEEYEAYVARIGLAAAKIDDNAYDHALALLEECPPEFRNWEWGRLAHLGQLSAGAYDAAGPVDAVAWSPDGTTLASGDWGGQVTVRQAETGEVRFQVPHGQYVHAVAYSPDGRRIASGSSDRTILIVDAQDGRVLQTLAGHEDGVLSVRFSPDGQRLVSGSYDNTARLWNLATGQTEQVLQGHSWWVWSADFSPDGERIVTAGQDGKAVVWQRVDGTQNDRMDQLVRPVAASGDRMVRPADSHSQYQRLTEFTAHEGAVYAARFSPTDDLVATGGYDKLVMVWNPDEVEPIDLGQRLEGGDQPQPNHLRLAGHDGPVRSVGFSPNGEIVLSGGEENTIRLWDISAAAGGPHKAGNVIAPHKAGDGIAGSIMGPTAATKTLRGHGSAVRSCVFSPDGRSVLSGSHDERIRLWNVEGYQEVRVLHAQVLAGHEDALLAARFSPDGTRVVTASRDRTARLWDASTGQWLRQFEEGHEFLASSAAFFADGRRLATGAGDNSTRIWNLETGTQRAVLYPTGRIGALAVSPDGRWIATGSIGNDVQIWDAQVGADQAPDHDDRSPPEPVATLDGHVKEVSALAFSPSGDRLATGDERGRLRVWRRGTEADPWTFEQELHGHNGSITGIRFTPDGRRLLTASGDRTCGQWDLDTGQELRELVLRHPDWVSSLDVSPDGELAVTTCDDGRLRLWRLADATELHAVQSPEGIFNSVSFSPDGRTAVVASSTDQTVYLWNTAAASDHRAPNAQQEAAPAGPLLEPLLDFNERGGLVWSVLFAPDGRHVLSIGGNDAVLWNLDTRRRVVRFTPHGALAAADVSPDGRQVATGSWDQSAKIWDVESGQAIRKLDGGHSGYINSIEFSRDGRELLTASDDGTAQLWDVASGEPTGVVFRPEDRARLFAATYSPDGRRVLTTGGDATARIWDHGTGQPLATLQGHAWAVLCGQFSPDGRRVITGSEDNTAKIWDAATGQPLVILSGHTAAVTGVAFSPDGKRALTASGDNSAKLWDAETGKEILTLSGHHQELTSASFSPDGRTVLTSSRDGTAILWTAADWRE